MPEWTQQDELNSIRIHPVAAGLVLVGVALLSVTRGQQVRQIPVLTPEQQEILSHMSIVYLDDGHGGQAKTVRFTGVNVQVVNGLGATNGYPDDPASNDPLVHATNSLGNLIVGYNEHPGGGPVARSGSHNIVAGTRNSFTSHGGLVVGVANAITGIYAVVSGGQINTASAAASSVSGDANNTASHVAASVSGGQLNVASGAFASVSGGYNNEASGFSSSIDGGHNNEATGSRASVGGGASNDADGDYSSILGGSANRTVGEYSSIAGGQTNTGLGMYSTIGGGRLNDANGDWSAVSGGLFNQTLSGGPHAVVCGGHNRVSQGEYDWVAGELFQDQ